MRQRGPYGCGIILAAGTLRAVLVRGPGSGGFALVVVVSRRRVEASPMGMGRLVLGRRWLRVLMRRRAGRVLVRRHGLSRGRWHYQRTEDLPKEHVEEDHQ